MYLIVTAASTISAIAMSAMIAARMILLLAGTGGATTLREYAVFAIGRFRSTERASSSCHWGPRVFFSGRGSYTERRGRVLEFLLRGWGTVP